MVVQYGIYHKGWTADTKHKTPWLLAVGEKIPAFDEDNWGPRASVNIRAQEEKAKD